VVVDEQLERGCDVVIARGGEPPYRRRVVGQLHQASLPQRPLNAENGLPARGLIHLSHKLQRPVSNAATNSVGA
jgi:hypothetical protein